MLSIKRITASDKCIIGGFNLTTTSKATLNDRFVTSVSKYLCIEKSHNIGTKGIQKEKYDLQDTRSSH